MKNSAIQHKREVLASISRKLRQIKETMIKRSESDRELIYWESLTINDMLMKFLYNKSGELEFKTFNQWKKEGKLILKGSKAVTVWGQPIKATRQNTEQEEAKPDEFKMYPICYLFASNNVTDRRAANG